MGLDRGIGERDAIWWVGGEVRRDRFCIEGRRGLNGGRETRRGVWDDWEMESIKMIAEELQKKCRYTGIDADRLNRDFFIIIQEEVGLI